MHKVLLTVHSTPTGQLYARGLGRIAFGAALEFRVTANRRRGAKFLLLLRVGKGPNRFLVQGKFGQLSMHKFLLDFSSANATRRQPCHLLGGLHSGQVNPVLQLVTKVAQNSYFFCEWLRFRMVS